LANPAATSSSAANPSVETVGVGVTAADGGNRVSGDAARSTTGLVRIAGRDPGVAGFDDSMVSFFVDAADLLGVPKSVAAIYAICFAAPEPLSFADIEQRLDISKGSISQGVRVLREVGALKSLSRPGDRREFFEPDLELRKLIVHWLDARVQTHLDVGQDRLQALAKGVPGGSARGSRVLRDRLDSLQSWHDKTRALLPMVKAFLKIS
jgi:HTH-type transcriptional regulator, glycine betaine synthesis regulator